MDEFKHVTLVGCGTIGLPCAVAFATRGVQVAAIDIDRQRVLALSQGRVGRLDDRLAQALAGAIADQTIVFSRTIKRSLEPTAFVIAVQTPVDPEGRAVWGFFQEAVASVLACARPGDLVILRSTVPVGTARKLADEARGRGVTIGVAACPDRSVSGDSFREQFSVPTIVGGVDADARRSAAALFARLGEVIEVASAETAEAVKLFCNVQRDIAFAAANQFALACESLGLDFEEIRRAGSQSYPRFSLARPGPVGGDCLTKDTFLLAASLGGSARSLPLARAARQLNRSLVDFAAETICRHVEAVAPRPPTIAILGTAFKGEPATTDQRHSFGVELAAMIAARLPAAEMRAWDPALAAGAAGEGAEQAINDADAVILANDHPFLGAMDLGEMAKRLRRGALIYDACGRDHRDFGALANDVVFHSFGRRAVRAATV